MTSWLLFAAAEAPKGGLFDLDATLPLMAVQVVLLTFVLNKLFFRPIGRAVEDREGFISTSRAEAKQKLAQAERLEADLRSQLKQARVQAQALILEAEEESERLRREALNAALAEANISRESARRKIDSERDSALTQLRNDADKLGDLIVQRLLAAQ